MTTYIKSINRKIWKVVETKIEIEDEDAPTTAEEILLQNNDIALSAIHDALDKRTFEQIKNTKKPPQFDGTNYPYWKSKMTTYIKSINRKTWKVVETKFEAADPENATAAEEVFAPKQ